MFNPDLDKCGGKKECSNKVAKELTEIYVDLDLVDIWRLRNLTKKIFFI